MCTLLLALLMGCTKNESSEGQNALIFKNVEAKHKKIFFAQL